MDKPSKSPSRPQARHGHPGALGPVHPTRRSGGGGPCSCMRLPYCSPLGISWGSTPHSSSQSAPHSRETAANASSISLPGGTVGWLWNLRLEQGSRETLPNATRLTHRVSESTNNNDLALARTCRPRVAGRLPRRLGNPPIGFLSCKPQTTALPRSPDVYRDPRLSPDVHQESRFSRDPSSGLASQLRLREPLHPDLDKPGI